MVRAKRKHLAEVVKNSKQNGGDGCLNCAVGSDLSAEDSWVIVKKQRVTIWIPPLPGAEKPSVNDLEQTQLPEDTHKDMTSASSRLRRENPPDICLAEGNGGSMASTPTRSTQLNAVLTQPIKSCSVKPNDKGQGNVKLREISAVDKRFIPFALSSLVGVGELGSSSPVLDKMMRASVLERTIAKAGGLDGWLTSLGLERFARIFHGKKINKFQLASLSMKKLKDMGVNAVGPRRKLIHAIEHPLRF